MDKLGNFLSIVPCHRKKERCIHIKGKPFPLCARCMAALLGYIAVPFCLLFIRDFKLSIFLLGIFLLLPLIIDGYTQLKGLRESTNTLRVLTGLLFGLGQSICIASICRLLLTLP